MIPLGVLASRRPPESSVGTVVLHELADCRVRHPLTTHSAAGHTLVGQWIAQNSYQVSELASLVAEFSNAYNPYALAEVLAPEMSIEARIVGRGTNGRDLGFTLGATVVGTQTASNAAIVTFGASSVNGVAYPAGTNADNFHALATLAGGRLKVEIDGTQIIDTTAPAAAIGTMCGLQSGRASWSGTVGYGQIIIRRL